MTHSSKCATHNLKKCDCDGYHTFTELYDHRIALWMALAERCHDAWVSETHSDGTKFDGWFVLGIGMKKGNQITYHLPMSQWGKCLGFARTLSKCPNFDGHTSDDVLERIGNI